MKKIKESRKKKTTPLIQSVPPHLSLFSLSFLQIPFNNSLSFLIRSGSIVMDPLNSLRKKFAVKRGSQAIPVSSELDSEHSTDVDEDDQRDSFASVNEQAQAEVQGGAQPGVQAEDEYEEEDEKEEDTQPHRVSVNPASEPFPGTPDEIMVPFSPVTPDTKETVASLPSPVATSPVTSAGSPAIRMSFDKLPRPPKKPAAAVKADKMDKELGLNKDYWAEVWLCCFFFFRFFLFFYCLNLAFFCSGECRRAQRSLTSGRHRHSR